MTTFVVGHGGTLRFRCVRERVRVKRQLSVFELRATGRMNGSRNASSFSR